MFKKQCFSTIAIVAMSLGLSLALAADSNSSVTVITPEHAVAVTDVLGTAKPGADGDLWASSDELTKINGLVLKPEGVCVGDLCIPLSRKAEDKLVAGENGKQYVNLMGLARKLHQTVVTDADANVWSFGPIPPVEQARMENAVAPDFALRDREGKLVRLADFRGRKVLLLTWASWCQCKQDLVGWQQIYSELKGKNFEIVAAAQDTEGEEAAGTSYDKAQATFTTLLDPEHTVSSLYQMINVPCGVWIDEQGKIVRPAEVAYSKDVELLSIKVAGNKYVEALRDWVINGDESAFALSGEALRARMTPHSDAAALADANFKLAVYFHQAKDDARADKYFAEAQKLQPDDWNYHRQQWSFTPSVAMKNWFEKFRNLNGKDYYEPLDIEPVNK